MIGPEKQTIWETPEQVKKRKRRMKSKKKSYRRKLRRDRAHARKAIKREWERYG